MEEVEGGFGAHAVAALEIGDGGEVGEAELGVEPANFGVFVGDPFIAPDEVARLKQPFTRASHARASAAR
mgnify:CR=1 FL=1